MFEIFLKLKDLIIVLNMYLTFMTNFFPDIGLHEKCLKNKSHNKLALVFPKNRHGMACLFQVFILVISDNQIQCHVVLNFNVVAKVRIVLKMLLFRANNRDSLFLYKKHIIQSDLLDSPDWSITHLSKKKDNFRD